ncbi:MAG: Inositol 2-dehydrogenase/D-chiro-inositol 3-dehydrogenase [Candidatus Omnitrophica bacterium]|nr:Inositol 2-dehydrogenase/D-chiro-inositol 3-dehydrogenase [Candidatus Omnitrophota bacterium]
MERIRIGVIGCGQWGPNQIRSFFFHPRTQVVRVCDKDASRLTAITGLYPGVAGTQDSAEVTRAADIDAVVITTPVSTHYALAKDALENGKDVLCEKPLTLRASEARQLAELARSKGRVLMVGHVFLFNPGILKLKELIDQRAAGQVYYLHAERTNLGPVRNDTNAVYDLASHDLSIFNYLLGGRPRVISAHGRCFLQKGIEDVAFVSLEYPGGVLAHIHVSWLDPKKIRQITVVGQDKMITWDDLSLTGPVEVYAKHVERYPNFRGFGEFYLSVKEGEVLIPHVKHVEPLRQQADHFVTCVQERKRPLADADSAAEIVETLEEIERILAGAR